MCDRTGRLRQGSYCLLFRFQSGKASATQPLFSFAHKGHMEWSKPTPGSTPTILRGWHTQFNTDYYSRCFGRLEFLGDGMVGELLPGVLFACRRFKEKAKFALPECSLGGAVPQGNNISPAGVSLLERTGLAAERAAPQIRPDIAVPCAHPDRIQ